MRPAQDQAGLRAGKAELAIGGTVWYQESMNALERVTVDPRVMSGRPCIRGMRVTVANVLRLLAAGHSTAEILDAYPSLEQPDIEACLLYASVRVEDEELAPVAA